MEINEATILEEIKSITDQPSTDIDYTWQMELIVGDQVVEVLRVHSVTVERDYVRNFSDEVEVHFSMLLGNFMYDVQPSKDTLKATLSKVPFYSKNRTETEESGRRNVVYECVLHETTSASATASGKNTMDKEESNKQEPVLLTADLIPLSLVDTMNKEVGGIFRDVTVKDVISLLLLDNVALEGNSQLSVNIDDFTNGEFEGIVGVDVVEPDNITVYKHIVIPPGIRRVDLPAYLQANYGVYGTGLGAYLQGGIWYVYPTHHTERFDSSHRKVQVINVPETTMPGAEVTYKKEGTVLSVLSTAEVKHLDFSDIDQRNLGNGYRLARSAAMIDAFSTSTKGKTFVAYSDNVTGGVIEHHGVKNLVRFAGGRISDNVFYENSKLSKRIGSEILVSWENAETDALKPGMPFKFLYVKEGEVVSLWGVVQGTISQTNTINSGLMEDRFNTKIAIKAYVGREQT